MNLAMAVLGVCLLVGGVAEDGTDPAEEFASQEIMHISKKALEKLHGRADANGDGKMSMTEVLDFAERMHHIVAKNEIKEILVAMDANKNGKLTLEEFRASSHHPLSQAAENEVGATDDYDAELEAETFKAADSDADGELNEAELPGFFYPETNDAVLDLIVADVLKRRDTDGNGVLSAREFWEITDGDVSESAQKDFQKFDTDGSGTLSAAEIKHWESGRFHMKESMETLFQVADIDGDGHVTAVELHKAKENGDLTGTDAGYQMSQWAEFEL